MKISFLCSIFFTQPCLIKINVTVPESQNKVHFKIFCGIHTVTVRHTQHLVLFRVDSKCILPQNRQQGQTGLSFRPELETPFPSPLRRCHCELTHGAQKIYADTGRRQNRLPWPISSICPPIVLCNHIILWKHQKGSIIGDPRTRLMRQPDPLYAMILRMIKPAPISAIRLWRKGSHSKGTLHQRQRISP